MTSIAMDIMKKLKIIRNPVNKNKKEDIMHKRGYRKNIKETETALGRIRKQTAIRVEVYHEKLKEIRIYLNRNGKKMRCVKENDV